MHLGDHGDSIMRPPAAYGAQEVDAISHGADRDLHFLGEALRIGSLAVAALEDDHVQSVLGVLGVYHLIRNAVGFHLTELGERQGVPFGILVGVEPGVGRSSEGPAEIKQAETSDRGGDSRGRGGTDVGDQVAQAFGSERLEALGHERGRHALT